MRFYITTIGCQMNQSDSERIAAYLKSQGFIATDTFRDANLIIINTCGVRQGAEDRAYGLVHRMSKENKAANIVITGCLSQRDDVFRRLKSKVRLFLPITELPQLVKVLNDNLPQDVFFKNYCLSKKKYLTLPTEINSKFSALVPIGNGCNNFCTYCVVPYARGKESYRPAKEIILEVKKLIIAGYKEITLLAQNVNSYQYGKIDFPKLLKMIANLEGDFWVRFASSHPKDMGAELIAAMASSPKICPHLHLPVQAGSDRILKLMNRNYTVAKYLKLIVDARAAIPNISISTDIIVGFPGETKADFAKSLKLFKVAKFDMAYISQYSPRYGTAAAKLKDNIAQAEKKSREYQLNEVLKTTALEHNQNYVNTSVRVLVDSKTSKGEYCGKTATAKNVIFASELDLIGKFVNVKINKAQSFGLYGALKPRVIAILGPTASGKTKLAVQLAKKLNGEIISADSRQVYKGMDIGTGKDLKEYGKIRYHLIDIVSPKKIFDLASYYPLAIKAIGDIVKRKKIPLLVGGSGLYAEALISGYQLSHVVGDQAFRAGLEKLSAGELFKLLKQKHQAFALRLHESDQKNPRRLIRYLEIAQFGDLGKQSRAESEFDFLVLAMEIDKDLMQQKIKARLLERLEQEDLIGEAKGLLKAGVSHERLEALGLEYRYVSRYLRDEIDYDTMVSQLYREICRFAKRQLSWLRRMEKQGQKIHWVPDLKTAEQIIYDY